MSDIAITRRYAPRQLRTVKPYTIGVSWWTPERVSQLLDLMATGGRTSKEIGEVLGTTKGAVIGRLARMGISKPRLLHRRTRQ